MPKAKQSTCKYCNRTFRTKTQMIKHIEEYEDTSVIVKKSKSQEDQYYSPLLNRIAKDVINAQGAKDHKLPLHYKAVKYDKFIQQATEINQAMYPGIKFDHKFNPIRVKKPLQLYEL